MRTDYLQQTKEIAHFALSTEIHLSGKAGLVVTNRAHGAIDDDSAHSQVLHVWTGKPLYDMPWLQNEAE